MSNILKHKNLIGPVEYSAEDNCLFGKLRNVNGLISYEGQSVEELKNDFIDACESYLEHCKEKGINPLKEYSGSFNIRLNPELHSKVVIAAKTMGTSLNGFIKDAVTDKLKKVSLL